MNYCELKTEKRLEYSDLLKAFVNGCKTDKKIGFEYERIPVYKNNYLQVPYEGDYGICELLKEFAHIDNWDYIYDDANIIGLKKNHNTITLEPGAQIELSIEPQENILRLKTQIETIDNKLKPILDKYSILLLNVGISPDSTYKNIKLIPKRRYQVMANYLWGILSDVMMRETAGIQVGIDFSSEDDAIRKFRLANLIIPFATAMFANSKIRGGVNTGYKSFRALAWLNTDNDRCGFATDFKKNSGGFNDYIKKLLNIPMIFIKRENKIINLNGKITFKQFMDNGFETYYPISDDWQLHSNLYFPEVRLRNFIEIRNHDCVGNGLEYSVPALYKGIMYSQSGFDEVEKILNKYTVNEIKELRYCVAKNAIYSKIHNTPILDICKNIVNISYQALKNEKNNEEVFLQPLIEMLNKGKCPCELNK